MFYKIVTLSLFSLFFSFSSLVSVSATMEAPVTLPAEKTWSEVVDYARENLPLEGQLVVKSDGFVYLKVDDAYIHDLFPMLRIEEEGYSEPPYFRTSDAPGAHISVFYVNEHVMPEEIGQTFHFDLNQIVIVKPSHETSYAVLQVHSPELEHLREKYGLSPKLFCHDYHISLAKKVVRHH